VSVPVVPTDGLLALVDSARRGDPDAWEALYRRLYPRMFAFARRRLSGDQPADDAVSEAMSRAIPALARFRSHGGGFEAWMFGILRNVVLEQQRSRARATPGRVPDGPCVEPGPLHRVLADEEARQVRSAFVLLSGEDQEVLELRVVAGLGTEAVAAALGKSAGAVRMAQSRALSRLRRLLMEGTPT
jgi:RNA polymerase sigma-70 factor (ECF subfamily)